MTATTTRGVKCGNCKSYHPNASDVRDCYLANENDTQFEAAARAEQAYERHLEDRDWEDAEQHRQMSVYDLPIAERWHTNNAANSPVARTYATEAQINFIKRLVEERKCDGITLTESNVMMKALQDKPITKNEASTLITSLKGMPKKQGKQSGYDPLPDVPAGHYAVPSRTGNNDLDFFRVDRAKNGRTYVKRIVGGHPEMNLRFKELRPTLQAILDFGPDKAAKQYADQLGRCYRCNRHLTDETSRQLGIGPDCRNR